MEWVDPSSAVTTVPFDGSCVTDLDSLKLILVPKVCWISCVTVEILRHTQMPTDRLNEITKSKSSKRIFHLFLLRKYRNARLNIRVPLSVSSQRSCVMICLGSNWTINEPTLQIAPMMMSSSKITSRTNCGMPREKSMCSGPLYVLFS